MDGSTFDRLTQLLTGSPSRRAAVRLLAGLVMLRSWHEVREASGALAKRKKRKKKKKCKGGKKKCGKQCRDLQTDPLNCGRCGNDCDVDKGCVSGICACPEGKKTCGTSCIPQDECCADADCGEGGKCGDGTCVCPVDKTPCGGICADLATDGANCGACGNACDTNGCVNGFCTCLDGGDCNGCICALRLEDGQTACTGDVTTQSCSVDSDCPARSFCRDAIGGFCSEPCPA